MMMTGNALHMRVASHAICYQAHKYNSNQDYVDVNSMHPLHRSCNIADRSQMFRQALHTNIDMTGNALHMRVALHTICLPGTLT